MQLCSSIRGMSLFHACLHRLLSYLDVYVYGPAVIPGSVAVTLASVPCSLGFTEKVYGIGSSIFFIGYALFQVGAYRHCWLRIAFWAVHSSIPCLPDCIWSSCGMLKSVLC